MTEPSSQPASAGARFCDCTTPTELEPMLTTKEVAAFLRISVDTLYAWRNIGQGPTGHPMGKHLRFYRDDLLAFVASKRER